MLLESHWPWRWFSLVTGSLPRMPSKQVWARAALWSHPHGELSGVGGRGLHPGVPVGDQHSDFGCPENPGDKCQALSQQWGISETLVGTPFPRPR